MQYILQIKMKSVIVLALIGSAAAFAPSTQGPVSAYKLISSLVEYFVSLHV
jgi:hypothetical protein